MVHVAKSAAIIAPVCLRSHLIVRAVIHTGRDPQVCFTKIYNNNCTIRIAAITYYYYCIRASSTLFDRTVQLL